MARWITRCWKIFKQYLSNCSIHGVRYLVDDGYSYLERFFWLIFCALSWWGCTLMIIGVLYDYVEHPVAVTGETMLTHWKTPFPAIAFCIGTTVRMRNTYFKKNPGLLERPSPVKSGDIAIEELISAYNELKVPCSEYVRNCSWNDVEFDCCKEFQLLPKTGVGPCIILNSYQTHRPDKEGLKFYLDNSVRHGRLVIDLIANSTTNNYIPKAPTDIFNEEGVKSFPIARRNCRFWDEFMNNSTSSIYSRDACYLQVYIRKMIEYCGCVNFYYEAPPGVRLCSVSDMFCLYENSPNITSQLALNKQCHPDCEGTELEMHYLNPAPHNAPPADVIRLDFRLLSYPASRYRRYVVHNLLDVIVSIGSAIGLFMGASILSLFEIPYWLFVRRDKIS